MGDKLDHALALLKARATQLGSDEPEESVTVKGSELLFLHATITSLREALEPFAVHAGGYESGLDDPSDSISGVVHTKDGKRSKLRVSDLRRARTALNPKERLDALLERARSNNPSRKETGI